MKQTSKLSIITGKQRLVLFMPLIAVELYLLVTLVLYQFGPYPWPTKNPDLVWILIALYHLAFIVGYYVCMKIKHQARTAVSMDNLLLRATNFFLIVNLAILLLNITRRFGLTSVDLIQIGERILWGFRSPSEVYNLQFDKHFFNFGGKGLTMFFLVTSPISFATIPLAIVYFKKLSLFFKGLLLVNVLLEIGKWVGIGTNKGIFDLVITIIVLAALSIMSYLYSHQVSLKKMLPFVCLLCAILLIFLVYFSNAIGSRLSGDAWLDYPAGGIFPTKDCLIFSIVPSSLQKPIAMLSLYVTQGYYALSLATTVPWIPMFGLGSSMFLQEYVDKYLLDISQFSYHERLAQFGWHPTVNWHSLYVWIANDLSVYGVVLFMFAFGFVFAYFYRIAFLDKNVLAKLIFIFLVIMVLFIPANNQVFGFLYPCMQFLSCIVCYLIFCKTQRVVV